jgi:RNA 3'-terminal phosphate cyclase (ATP)
LEPLTLDGSYGEGGGQTLRTAVAFSVIKKRPVRVTNIRAGRSPPGLKNQHASTLKVLSEIFGARLQGAEVGSNEVTFSPAEQRVSEVKVDMKTAASITLVLQAVIPAVALSGSGLALELRGGTDVPWSPTFDYLDLVAREAYRTIGIRFSCECLRRGYYPKGGGIVKVEVLPSKGVEPVDFTHSKLVEGLTVVSRCALLPRHVAERQADSAALSLATKGYEIRDRTVSVEQADSPGSSLLVYSSQQGRIVGADGLGERGKRAENVGDETAGRFLDTLARNGNVDPNLADMMAPLLCLAGGDSTLVIPRSTSHLETSLHIAQQFTGCGYSIDNSDSGIVVRVKPMVA